MGSAGKGRRLNSHLPNNPERTFSADLRFPAHVPGSTAAAILNKYWWGTGIVAAPAPTEIPLLWLSQPLPHRMDPPYNDAEVTQAEGGAVARRRDKTSIAEIGVQPYTATLNTATAGDAAALAAYVIAQRGEARVRSPRLTVNLLLRTDSERKRLLRIRRGRRILITGVPAEFPEGADSLVVTGISHEIGVTTRLLHLTTAAVVGTTPGVPGPWFRLGSSVIGGDDVYPF